jgi:DNA-binding Xre family transcriptional regulator
VIKIKIPELLEQNNLNATDLMRKGNIAYGTALRLSKGEGGRISFDVLENLCKLFNVSVEEILEYVPDKNS